MEEYRSNMNILKEVLRGKRPHDDVEFVAWLSTRFATCFHALCRCGITVRGFVCLVATEDGRCGVKRGGYC